MAGRLGPGLGGWDSFTYIASAGSRKTIGLD